LLAFPIRDDLLSIKEIISPQHAFWKTPLVKNQLPGFAFLILIFSIGFASAYQRHGLIGLLPLGFGIAYNIWSALFFTSGDRFVVPLDWSIHLYQTLGLLILASSLLLYTNGARENVAAWFRGMQTLSVPIHPFDNKNRRLILTFILILFLGLFLPLTESAFPKRYPPRSQAEITHELGIQLEEGEIVLYGRALYPRYYEADDGEPETAKTGYAPAKEARIVFFLVGSTNTLVVFELADPPGFFPNTADVVMIGQYTDNYFTPRVVEVIKDSKSEIYLNE